MNSTKKELTATGRKVVQKHNKKLRREGFVPAVVFGPIQTSTNIQINEKSLLDILRTTSSSSIIKLNIDDKFHNVIIREIQRNPRDSKLTHVSFFEPDPEKHMIVDLDIVPVGISPAVKNNLGILFTAESSMSVKCLPGNIVDSIEVDITHLEKVGDTINVGDIKLPEGIELHRSEDATRSAITISPFQKEVVEEVKPQEVAGAEGAEGTEAGAEGKTEGTETEGTEEKGTEKQQESGK